MNKLIVFLVISIFPGILWAKVQSETIRYQHNGANLKGEIYWDDEFEGKRPGVMVVHEWWGLNDYAKSRAKMLAAAGFVAFAADMYGDNKVTKHARDAKGWMQQITANTRVWQERALLALEKLKQKPMVEPANLAAIGYCFGGSTVIQMAYAGADLKGVVSFHGSLPAAAKGVSIKPKVLIAHGADDSFVPMAKVNKFAESMIKSGADWEIDIYGGARYAFTNKQAAQYGIDNVAYNEQADYRSWQRLMEFFNEIFE